MPKCTIDGKEVEVPPGTTVIQAAAQIGIDIPHFCWHPDLPVDGNCRMCLVEIEKVPKLQIACNTQVTEGMVVQTKSEKAQEAHRTTLEFLLINHPIDCPVCDQAGECYLQDIYMEHGLHNARVEIEDKVAKRKVVDLGPIMLDAERCVMCSRCVRFEREVTGTDSFQFVNRGDRTEITTYRDGPITHNYSGNLADVCPVGALLSHDFRFKMRVWFLEEHASVCPGCSTGCNVFVDERDGEVQRIRPRRNVDVNRSWMCDIGRELYRPITVGRTTAARRRKGAAFEAVSWEDALDDLADRVRRGGAATAFIASPQATNEDLYAFRALAELAGGMLDFRVDDPQDRVQLRSDTVLLREDRNPNTQGCLELGLGRTGIKPILTACREGRIAVLVLQGPELLGHPDAASALEKVPFVAVLASFDSPELERAHLVLPVALWAEVDGSFTNHARRLQRIQRAIPAPGAALPRFEIAARLLARLGQPLGGSTAREVFALAAEAVPAWKRLDHRKLGASGHALASNEAAVTTGART